MKITHEQSVEEVGVSHYPEIKKRVLVEKGEVPQLMTCATAVFGPGQSVDLHSHKTMYEVFYVLYGKAEFTSGGQTKIVEAGDCIVIPPGEEHVQRNPFEEEVKFLYYGIAVD